MAVVYGEDSLERTALGAVTAAVPSNQGIDLARDMQQLGSQEPSYRANLAQRLLVKHPSYGDYEPKWCKYLDLYESNDIYRFIQRHLRETKTSWEKRVARGYYNNYVASVVDLYTSYIYSAPIDRTIPPELTDIFTDAFYKNVDFGGNSLKNFMMDVCTYAQVMGHVGILVDAPVVDTVVSEQDRLAQDIRPYLTLVHAQQIFDWELDKYGKFKWVKLCMVKPQERTWDDEYDADAKTIVVWTTESWEVYTVTGKPGEEKATLDGSGPNPLGEVPLIICKFQKAARHPWYGVSPVRDIADLNIGILNWSSLGDEEIFERCLNILVMERSGDDSKPELSHHNVLEYEGTNPPEYLVPGETPLKLIREWISFHVENILRLAKLKGPTGMKDVRQASSGIAYAFEFNETNQTLANRAEALQMAESEIHRLVAAYFGKEFDGAIAYSREFGVDDLLVELQGLTIGRQALTTEMGIKELEKRVLRKIFSKLPTDLRLEMEQEVEEADAKPDFESLVGTRPPSDSAKKKDNKGDKADAASEDSGDTADEEPNISDR